MQAASSAAMAAPEATGLADGAPAHGLVILNTGEGKGKTTAALGMMTRAWGRQLRVGVVQFLKHSQARFGETLAAERMGIDWLATGDGWTWRRSDLSAAQELAVRAWDQSRERIVSGRYDLLVLDEFTYPLTLGWLDTTGVVAWLRAHRPAPLHLVLTGRYAPAELVEYADLVTEMREVKHPWRTMGLEAQPGVEY